MASLFTALDGVDLATTTTTTTTAIIVIITAMDPFRICR